MVEKMRTRRRHIRLMRAAKAVIRDAAVGMVLSSQAERVAERVTPAQVACLVFARYGMRIDDEEAADYLAAALVSLGYRSDHRPAPAV
ncbi:hypothetical protein [Streptomyces olivaceus]|uniref:hypothetical protein n=1 Tax=Streptomyces olivaceus TaxID=47716 RepID=UPI001CC96D05|nr:hypothetical protein [Streptomyces olivaceus]MBZ6142461.1 hypothetical protein [Streptomyces olivaceus]MBZ6170170.1 hypothetical protein [Streptomyces olivaceus]